MNDPLLHYNATSQTWLLWLKAHPKANRTEAYLDATGTLHLKVNAPPVEGEANKAIIQWVSKQLKHPKRAITLVKGETASLKCLSIKAIEPSTISAFWMTLPAKD